MVLEVTLAVLALPKWKRLVSFHALFMIAHVPAFSIFSEAKSIMCLERKRIIESPAEIRKAFLVVFFL